MGKFKYSQEWYEKSYHSNLVDGSFIAGDLSGCKVERDTKCLMDAEIDQNDKILVCGCGGGDNIVILDTCFNCKNITAIDFSKPAVDFCTTNFPWINGIQCSVDNIPLPDNSFDVVLGMDITEHLPVDIYANFLKEVYRVLRFSGKFILLPGMTIRPEHINLLPLYSIRQHLFNIGFEISKMNEEWIIVKKPQIQEYSIIQPLSRYLLEKDSPITDEELLQYFPNEWADQHWLDFAVNMLCQIRDVFKKHDIEWMLISGTLLGAIRHGGLIPWDDDLDITVLASDIDKLKNACENFPSPGTLIETHSPRDGRYFQMCLEGGEDIGKRGLRWPFIDIFFHTHENGQVSFSTEGFILPEKDVYPLQQIEFEGELFPAMKNPYERYFDPMYPGWQKWCVSNDWCHRKERSTGRTLVKVPIDRLRKYYKFLI